MLAKADESRCTMAPASREGPIHPELTIRMLIVGYSYGIGLSVGCAKRSSFTLRIAGSSARF